MKNITVSVPDDVYREARVEAAKRGSSVSALVGEYLSSLLKRERRLVEAASERRRIVEKVEGFSASASDRLTRDELYDRSIRENRSAT